MTEPLQPNTVTPPIDKPTPPIQPPATTVTPPEPLEEKKFTQAELEKHIAERLEQAKRVNDEKLAKEKQAAMQKELVDKQEWQKLAETTKAELEAANRKLHDAELLNIKRDVGSKYNIPAELVGRLVGETVDEIEADATKVAPLFVVKPGEKPSPGVTPTNPGGDATPRETPDERRKRLLS